MRLSSLLLTFVLSFYIGSCAANEALDVILKKPQYVCPPCPHVNNIFETKIYEHDGICSVCGMALIELDEQQDCSAAEIHSGSGNFCFSTNRNVKISVFYHLPKKLTPDSRVLIVMPGAGRAAWDYRDDWVAASEKYNVVVLSPAYSESLYPGFWNYNLGGMISDVKIDETQKVMQSYKLVDDPSQWLFDDFDNIFELAATKLALTTQTYDMFGHSAGGQILHRYAMFVADSQASRILASNSGWYTTVNFEQDFPYGLKNGVSSEGQMKQSFSKNLFIFLGELDNDEETRGQLVRNSKVDVQGTNRLARGEHFYQQAKQLATSLGSEFNWRIKIVPGVGHEHRKMALAAADYLYAQD